MSIYIYKCVPCQVHRCVPYNCWPYPLSLFPPSNLLLLSLQFVILCAKPSWELSTVLQRRRRKKKRKSIRNGIETSTHDHDGSVPILIHTPPISNAQISSSGLYGFYSWDHLQVSFFLAIFPFDSFSFVGFRMCMLL